MGTIRWRRGKDGRLWATLIWKVGRVQRTEALHTTDPVLARARLAAWRAKHGERTQPAASWRWPRALDAFLASVGETASAVTVGCYRGPLERMFRAWDASEPATWTTAMFRLYVADHPKWKPRTKQLLVHAARRFLAWARKESFPVADFAGDYRAPKIVSKPPDTLEAADFEAFVRASQDMDGEVAVGLAALAGLRLGEIARAEWRDFRPAAAVLQVRGRKGHAERILPVGPHLRRLLLRHYKIDGMMVPNAISDVLRPQLRRIARAAGVARVPTVRVLRHGFATRLVAAGVDIATVQYLLGHKSPAMTLRYAHSDPERARAAVGKVLLT